MRLSTKVSFISVLVFAALPLAGQSMRTESYKGNDVVSGEILVRFRGASLAQSQALAAQDADITSVESVGQTGAILIRSRGRDVTTLLQTYQTRADVLYAEPNYVWHTMDVPNDQFFGQQYGLMNTGQTLRTPGTSLAGTAGADISAQQAWDITEGSRGVVVGIVDTGVDYTHPDLASNIWSAPRSFTVIISGQTITCGEGTHGFNAITRTCDPLDDNGHGTHVSGIIGAAGNNGIGVSGVNRVGTIIASKFLGSGGSGTTIDAIAALEFLIQVKTIFGSSANVRVLNNSWGGGGLSIALSDEIALTSSNDMLFVVAAGNGAVNNDLSNAYPANYASPNIVAVAATDNRDGLASFSEWGPTKVHLGAPGVNVFSTWPSASYAFLSGTSMATPMVAGAAALVLSACPLTTAALKSDLLTTVDPIPSLTNRTVTNGRLNVYRALTNCAGTAQAPLIITVTPGAQSVDPGKSVDLTVSATAAGPVNLTAFNLPAGVAASFNPPSVAPGTALSTLTLTATASATDGVSVIGIGGTIGGTSRSTGVLLTVGSPPVPIGAGQTIRGNLSATSKVSLERPGKHADFYALTLSSSTAVTIDMKSRYFDAYLYLLSSSGTILFFDDQTGGSNNARITQTLSPGTYFIEATSFLDGGFGEYTLSINTPTLSFVTPPFAVQGSTATVTLSGTRFTSPMTLSVGAGITVGTVNVLSPTLATAILTISSTAALTARDITVTTADGTSNPLTFAIPTPIAVGQRISGTLSTTDYPSRNFFYRYGELYQFTLTSRTPVTIDMRSDTVDAYAFLLSSTGLILASDDQSGGNNNARITTTLDPGSYFIEATSFFSFQTGDYTLSINLPVLASISPVFVGQGSTVGMTLMGTRFAAPMTIDAGTGISIGGVNVVGTTTATTTFTVAGSAPVGPHNVTATTPAGISSTTTVRVVPPIPQVTLGQPINGALTTTDPLTALPVGAASAGSYADVYQIAPLTTSTTVTITVQSADFDTVLAVWSPIGLFAYSNDTPGSSNSRITFTLAAGTTYFVEVSSLLPAKTGNYTLLVSPLVLSSVSPNIGAQGATVNVTLFGNRFVPTMTIDAGPGISATVLTVPGATTATATFTIAANAALGARDVTVTTSEGTTNTATFTVIQAIASMPSIAVGQTLSGTLGPTDQPSPHRSGQYADFYQLTVTATTAVNIDMKSTALNSYLFLVSSTGFVMSFDDNTGGGTNARIAATLTAGTYFIEATSSVAGIGDYTLSVATAPPVINSITPANGAPGRTVSVTLTGQLFVAPMTVDAGPGIAVSAVSLINSTSATAVFTMASSATLGDRNVTATTTFGTGTGVPFTVTPPSFLNFSRSFTASDLTTTGFAIVNPGPVDALVTFTLYNTNGQQLSASNQTIPAKSQFAKLGSELFPNVTQSGWVQATSSVAGLQAFWIGGDFRNNLDGADAGPVARELIFQLVTSLTEINIANIGSDTNAVTLRIYGATGTEVSPAATVNIPPNGVLKALAPNLFPLLLGTPYYIRATGTRNISGTAVTPNYPLGAPPEWTVLNGIDPSRPVTEIDFPHVPSGPQDGSPAWTSIIGVTNLSTSAQVVTITFTPNTGSPMSTTRVLLGNGSLRESMDSLFNLSTGYQEGWVRITAFLPINGFIAYGFSGTGGATTVAGQSTARSSVIFDHVANGPLWSTGLALLNTTSTDANVDVYIMRATGALVGKASFTLARGTKIAKQLTELIPASTADDGFVYVRTTNNVPIYGIQLFYSRDNRLIANIPAGAIDPSITYTPPEP